MNTITNCWLEYFGELFSPSEGLPSAAEFVAASEVAHPLHNGLPREAAVAQGRQQLAQQREQQLWKRVL